MTRARDAIAARLAQAQRPAVALGSAQPVHFVQGTVAFWDTTTGANTITVDGVPFTNVPVINPSEIPLIGLGNTVAVLVIGTGSTTLAVVGRVITQ